MPVKALLAAFGLAVMSAALSSAAQAQPLVEAAWLKANLGRPGLVVLDIQPSTAFAQAHIPGAVNSEVEKAGWRVDINGVPDMMNTPDKLALLIGGLGIDADSHVVVVPMGLGAGEVAGATRVYWTFKRLGHEKLSILNGGFRAWSVDKANPVESGAASAKPVAYAVKGLRAELAADKTQVAAAIAARTPLVDGRTEDMYVGVNKSPKAKRHGTLPGASNLPMSWLTDNNGGRFRDPAQLQALFEAAGVPTKGPQIHFCNTGFLASLDWFVASELLGNRDARLYDGSLAEWTQDPAAPVERKIDLP
jgi:thiosulfate/3-mercaptopyruvate sulfurtransferase